MTGRDNFDDLVDKVCNPGLCRALGCDEVGAWVVHLEAGPRNRYGSYCAVHATALADALPHVHERCPCRHCSQVRLDLLDGSTSTTVHETATAVPLEPGMVVVTGIDTPADVAPCNGWIGTVQPRTLNRRVILQTRVWIDVRAVVHRTNQMSPAHRANVVAMLLSQEQEFTQTAVLVTAAEFVLGDLTLAEADAKLKAVAALGDGWMERTPLVRHLEALNAAEHPVERTEPP